jgi:uncharacterized protein (DUF2235 family)
MARNIVLFIDGSGNDDSAKDASNVLLLSRMTKAAAEDPQARRVQVQHYIEGVGTDKPHRLSPPWLVAARLKHPPKLLHRKLGNLAGAALGYGIARRIKEAYAFLVQHYERGDNVYLFGFSRGAYAVRSLAGFLQKVGILLQREIAHVEEAFHAYEHGGNLQRVMRRLGHPSPADRERGTDLPIHMIGVWDTVAMHGVPRSVQWLHPSLDTTFHDTRVPDYVAHVRHALALHEVRKPFEPLLFADKCHGYQSLLQVWFPGAHSDVGGSYPAHERDLSDLALEWMACEAAKLGLLVELNPARTPHRASLWNIHHEAGKGFRYTGVGMRKLLRGLPTAATVANDMTSHRLHEIALQRLRQRPAQDPPQDPYNGLRSGLRALFAEVDEHTKVLDQRLQVELGVSPLPWQTDCTVPRNKPFADVPTPTGMTWQRPRVVPAAPPDDSPQYFKVMRPIDPERFKLRRKPPAP